MPTPKPFRSRFPRHPLPQALHHRRQTVDAALRSRPSHLGHRFELMGAVSRKALANISLEVAGYVLDDDPPTLAELTSLEELPPAVLPHLAAVLDELERNIAPHRWRRLWRLGDVRFHYRLDRRGG